MSKKATTKAECIGEVSAAAKLLEIRAIPYLPPHDRHGLGFHLYHNDGSSKRLSTIEKMPREPWGRFCLRAKRFAVQLRLRVNRAKERSQ